MPAWTGIAEYSWDYEVVSIDGDYANLKRIDIESDGAGKIMENEKVFAMSLGKVYPLLVAKAERKGRTKAEVDEVTCWLTGYTKDQLDIQISEGVSYGRFFAEAPAINPNATKITGSVCGIKVQEIEDPLMQKIRWLDKLVDELAKGKPMEKIIRQ